MSQRGLAESLFVIRRLSGDLANRCQALAERTAGLRSQSTELLAAAARLKRTGLDLQAGHPPVPLLFENLHNVVFRRAYHEVPDGARQRPWLLFYGADVRDEVQGFFLAPPVEASAVRASLARPAIVATPPLEDQLLPPAAAHAPPRLTAVV